MDNRLQVHTHSTSKTRALPIFNAEPLAYAVVPRYLGRSQTLVTELIASNFSHLQLRCPISASVSWSEEMNSHLAVDYVFQWHGQGDSIQEALQDLADVIAEDYEDLQSWPGELSEPLQQRLTIMKRYFEDAS